MSKINIGFATIILAAALLAPTYAAHSKGGHHSSGGGGGGGGGGKSFGGHHGGHHGVHMGGGNFSGRSMGTKSFSTKSMSGSSARWNSQRSGLSRNALISGSGNRWAGRNLNARNGGQRFANAGWRHNGHGHHGRFGWVGPLYWPFAYGGFYDYLWWGDEYDFWGYGYGGIFAGMFSPYGYDELAAYRPRSGRGDANANVPPDQLTQLCGEDGSTIASLPIDRFRQALSPNEAQRAALDDLAAMSRNAAQIIKAACPTDIALTAPGRLANMQARIEAMSAATAIVQPALEKFYDLLSDEQKIRLAALGGDRRRTPAKVMTTASIPQTCGATLGVPDWPAAEIDRTLRPTEAQRASLTALQSATTKAEEMLKGSCQTDKTLTPPARLAAVGQRLDIMLQAVRTVRSALSDFYTTLTDEQKARFEALGPQQMGQGTQVAATPNRGRRYGHLNIEGVIRRLMAGF